MLFLQETGNLVDLVFKKLDRILFSLPQDDIHIIIINTFQLSL